MTSKSKKLDKMLIGGVPYASQNSIKWAYRSLFLKGIYSLAPQVFESLYKKIYPLDSGAWGTPDKGPLVEWEKFHNLNVYWFHLIACLHLLRWDLDSGRLEIPTNSKSDPPEGLSKRRLWLGVIMDQNAQRLELPQSPSFLHLGILEGPNDQVGGKMNIRGKDYDLSPEQFSFNSPIKENETLESEKDRILKEFKEQLDNAFDKAKDQVSNMKLEISPQKIPADVKGTKLPREMIVLIEFQVNKMERPEICDKYESILITVSENKKKAMLETVRKDIKRAADLIGIKLRKGRPGKRAKKKPSYI